jgi:RimJ/RimL family protein N-acetyltransferase
MSMVAGDFARMRSAETGSWLLPEWRGQGLGAREARSSAHPDNAPWHAVSRALGYRTDGTLPMPAGGEEPVTATSLLLTRERWRRRTDVVLAGLEERKPLFGLPSGGR